MSTARPLQLRRNEERRIRQGHHWVYSNEVDIATTPLKSFAPGEPAQLLGSNGKLLGIVQVSPHSLICARLLSRDPQLVIDRGFFSQRFQAALQLRQRLFSEPFYRLVYGDSDNLSGLIVDRYGEFLVVQIATAGMEALIEEIVAALVELLSPAGIVLRNDSSVRELEQLPSYTRVAFGAVPDQIELRENGVRFRIAPASGQKTGWFYDHRNNRQRLAVLSSGRRVLDVFSYVGGWGVQAAVAGATEVVCIDSSEPATILARANAALNGVAERIRFRVGNAVDEMHQLSRADERFDVVVLDPPAFIKKRRDQKSGEAAYHRLNGEAMQLLADDAILVSASCSLHLSEEALLQIVRTAAHQAHRQLQLLEVRGQGPDHPIHPAIPETRYLKTLVCRVCR